MAAVSKAVNDQDRSYALAASLVTRDGMALSKSYTADDMNHHYLLPGPSPYTPVRVTVTGAVAKVDGCLMNRGWSLDRATNRPVRKREVNPVAYGLRKVGGRWKVDHWSLGKANCKGVKIAEVMW